MTDPTPQPAMLLTAETMERLLTAQRQDLLQEIRGRIPPKFSEGVKGVKSEIWTAVGANAMRELFIKNLEDM